MSTLFILHRSDPTRWDLVLKLAKSGDAVVLIQDGVVVAVRPAEDSGIKNLVQRGVKILALKADMDARRPSVKHGVEGIDYAQLVDLLIRYDRTFS
jgi:sulfur relay protein TusB/DsrH